MYLSEGSSMSGPAMQGAAHDVRWFPGAWNVCRTACLRALLCYSSSGESPVDEAPMGRR